MTTSPINLADLDGTDGFRIRATPISVDGNGFSVSAAGDVNGDGIDDVIIGAPEEGYDDRLYAGSSYVVFGTRDGFDPSIDPRSFNGTNGFRIDGVAAYDYSGLSVSAAGDVNGDGIDDVIVKTNVGTLDTYSYVVFGTDEGFGPSISLGSLDGTNGFRLDGAYDVVGGLFSAGRTSVSGAGDVNGDGIDDVILGAPYASPDGSSYAGESYVVFGTDRGFDATIDLGSLDGTNGFRLDGAASYDYSGFSVSGAGDVNGDGIDDVIVGASAASPGGQTSAGATYVVFGTDEGFDATIDLGSLDGTNGFRLDGAASYDYSGFSVSGAGDVNGDGVDDVIVGAPEASSSAGASYVVFGTDEGFDAAIDLGSLDGTNGFRLDGEPYSESGFSVSAAGDVNGDGIDDVIVGAPEASPDGSSYSYHGSSYVVFGTDQGFDAIMDLADIDGTNGLRLDGGQNNYSGFSVSAAGDVNGDGVDDVIVGAPNTFLEDIGFDSRSYVVFGAAGIIQGTEGPDSLEGTESADEIAGLGGDDTLLGKAGDDTIDGGAGNDQLFGGGGDDLLIGGAGDDLLDGGEGIDTVSYESAGGRVAVFLTHSEDVLGGQGVDTFVSIENVIGTFFSDRIVGDDADNHLIGLGGNDVLIGGAGNDILDGGNGWDELIGSGGDDLLIGGFGNDRLFGLGGEDTFHGDGGDDYIEGGLGADIVDGGAGNDVIIGSFGEDVLDGSFGDDDIRGDGSADILTGGAGKDRLVGGNGADRLWGGVGNDMLFGGFAFLDGDGLRDEFVFKSFANGGGGFDIIRDFDDDIDKLDLRESGYTSFDAVFEDAYDQGGAMFINFDFGGLVRIDNFDRSLFDAGDVLL